MTSFRKNKIKRAMDHFFFRYFQLVFQKIGTLIIYLRYYLTLNNSTKTRYEIQ